MDLVGIVDFFNWFYGWNLWPIISAVMILFVAGSLGSMGLFVWSKWFKRDS